MMKRILKTVKKSSVCTFTHVCEYKRHYAFGLFGTFAIIKMILFFVGSLGTFSHGDAFAVGGPTASDVTITGNANVGETLTGSYIYNHNNGWNPLGSVGFSDGGVGGISLTIDTNGTPFVAFMDYAHEEKATVMKFNETNREAVGVKGFSDGWGGYPSLAIYNETPYLAYSDQGTLMVMKFNGTSWEAVGGSLGSSYGPSLAIWDGTPYVIYGSDFTKGTVVKFTGSAWEAVGNIEFSDGGLNYTSLAIYDGIPYVAYRDYANSYKATVMMFNSGTNLWDIVGTKGLSDGAIEGMKLSIYNGTPYIAYADVANSYKATVMKFNGTNREVVGVKGFSDGGANDISLFIYDGIPYVTYRDGAHESKATLMKFNGTNREVVGVKGFSDGGVGFSSLVVDGDGTLYVAYQDEAHGEKATLMTFSNPDNPDLEGISTYKWYRDGDEIVGMTGITYTILTGDQGKTITFEVTPISQSGFQGTPVQSEGITIPYLPFNCSNSTDVPQNECEALVALYTSTNGTNRGSQSHWLGNGDDDPTTVCDRNGVGCEGNHITELNLASYNLSGDIPLEIGNLTHLTYLNVHANFYINSIPTSIGNLTDLQTLLLGFNNLSTLPSTIGNLSNLQDLGVQNNKLVTLPESLTNLENLTILQVENNCIDINELLQNIISFVDGIQQPYLGHNWKDLQYECAAFSCANVYDVPEEECEALVDLYNNTEGNGRTQNTNWLGQGDGSVTSVCDRYSVTCTYGDTGANITDINLDTNNLVGTIPTSISSLTSMNSLSLNSNSISSIPATIANLPQLRTLKINHNTLSSFPAEIGNSPSIATIDFSNNLITSVPVNIMNLITLSSLNLAYNCIETGTMSEDLITFLDLKDPLAAGNPGGGGPGGGLPGDGCPGRDCEIGWGGLPGGPGGGGPGPVIVDSRKNHQDACLGLPVCGNGTIETGETCDDGFSNGNAGFCNVRCDGTVADTSHQPIIRNGSPDLIKDQCTDNRDCSSSYYDNVCGPCPDDLKEEQSEKKENVITPACGPSNITPLPYTDELHEAYLWAKSIGITSMPTIQQAHMEGKVLREHLAKMITEFAIKVLQKKPNTKLACSFADVTNESAEMKFYIKTACQLGVMGRESDGLHNKTMFNPKETITRAQFGTVLSRLLYDGKNNTNNAKLWYVKHLNALHEAGIINDISNPNMEELRGYLMLMLMRSTEK